MIWRPWIIGSLLAVAVVVNLVLLIQERLPTAEVAKELDKTYDEPLRSLQYMAGNRRNNFQRMGMSPELAESTAAEFKRFDRQAERFRKLLEEQSAEMTDFLCPSEKLPQPYAMLAYLVYETNSVRYVVEPQNLLKFERQLWFERANLPALYDVFERTTERKNEASLMAVSAALLGRERSALAGESPWGRGLLTPWGFSRLEQREPRVRKLAQEYFALMHFLTEIANEPQRGICS